MFKYIKKLFILNDPLTCKDEHFQEHISESSIVAIVFIQA